MFQNIIKIKGIVKIELILKFDEVKANNGFTLETIQIFTGQFHVFPFIFQDCSGERLFFQFLSKLQLIWKSLRKEFQN